MQPGFLYINMKYKYLKFILVITITQIAVNIFPQTNCDEGKILVLEDVRRSVENSLIDAVTVTAGLKSGIEITAFYKGSELIKISTTDNLSETEQIFFSKGHLKIFERSGYRNGKQYYLAWYADEGKIFCCQNLLSERFLEPDDNQSLEILKTVDEYLLALQ
jgi:hypothetical protein